MKLYKKIIMITFFVLAIAALSGAGVQAKTKSKPKVIKKSISIIVGKGRSLATRVKGSYKNYKWKSADKKTVTVNKKGKILAKKAGETAVTAKSKKRIYKFMVFVIDHVSYVNYGPNGSKEYIDKQLKYMDVSFEKVPEGVIVSVSNYNNVNPEVYADSFVYLNVYLTFYNEKGEQIEQGSIFFSVIETGKKVSKLYKISQEKLNAIDLGKTKTTKSEAPDINKSSEFIDDTNSFVMEHKVSDDGKYVEYTFDSVNNQWTVRSGYRIYSLIRFYDENGNVIKADSNELLNINSKPGISRYEIPPKAVRYTIEYQAYNIVFHIFAC